jgi:esterase
VDSGTDRDFGARNEARRREKIVVRHRQHVPDTTRRHVSMSIPALHCETVGTGPDVVVLHGLFGAGRNWLSIARALAGDFRCHFVDLRNHGRSPHAPSMTYLDMAADVRALVERLGLETFTLVGHSMGGKAAMTLALTDPARIARLVAVDIAPVSYPDRFAEMIRAMRALDLGTIRRRAEADAALAAAIPDLAVRQFILQNLTFSGGVAGWRANLAALEDQMPHILGPLPVPDGARFERPTWFVRGELSDRVRPEHFELMQRWFPGHHLETVAGGGHWPHAEAPEAFMTVFRRALGG